MMVWAKKTAGRAVTAFAITPLLLALASGPALAQSPGAAPLDPAAPDRAVQAAVQGRAEYRQQLIIQLAQREAVLKAQQADLDNRNSKLKQTLEQLLSSANAATKAAQAEQQGTAVAETADGSQPAADGSDVVRLSKDYEQQVYAVQVARAAVLSSQQEVEQLRGLIARLSIK